MDKHWLHEGRRLGFSKDYKNLEIFKSAHELDISVNKPIFHTILPSRSGYRRMYFLLTLLSAVLTARSIAGAKSTERVL